MSADAAVYRYLDPGTGRTHYIGTTLNPERRKARHGRRFRLAIAEKLEALTAAGGPK